MILGEKLFSAQIPPPKMLHNKLLLRMNCSSTILMIPFF